MLRSGWRNSAVAACFLLAAACGRRSSEPPPLSPREALQSFRLSEDFRVELFLAEPDVVDPVDLAF
ncbi:MAG: hypothetical protein NZM33_17680, partial [Bryobacteraceae bacterium]|nr:hypothetical protein [Bryobacteraceae bacterium]